MTAGIVSFTPDITAASVPKLIRASKTFTGAANLGATGVNELFTTTGAVLIEGFWVRCTSDLLDAVDGALFRLGITGNDGFFTAAVYEGVFDLDTIDAGMGLNPNNSEAVVGYSRGTKEGAASGDYEPGGITALFANIIMTISGQAITGGTLEFYFMYRPLSANGALSLGAGMVQI